MTPVPFGSETRFPGPLPAPCHDCGVQLGELHLRGCDIEECPVCGQQLISCGGHAEHREEV